MAFGKYAVNYEMRIDHDRLRKERWQWAKEMNKNDSNTRISTRVQ
jgi:hypothetical protein